VVVPKGLEIVDQRLVAHGFTVADGIVLEGKVTDIATHKPLAARMKLERIEPQQTGGYRYVAVAEAAADAEGRWFLKHAPAGWHRVLLEANGYVPRVVGYGQFDQQPRWASYDGGLSRPASVSGRVTDSLGQPIADVDVRLSDLVVGEGDAYTSPSDYVFKTDRDGRFHSDLVPAGRASVWIHKEGYCRPGLGPTITMPAKDIELGMVKAARLVVSIDFSGKARPEGYIVNVEPEGGNAVGKWGGSGNIDKKNQITFQNIPPGRYVIHGRPNPSSADQETERQTVDLAGGKTTELTLSAR
jgi:hypothetical protein